VEREPDIDAAVEVGELVLARTTPVGLNELAAIFAGGFLGALLRAALEQWLGAAPGSWPWATFAVNLGASALLVIELIRLGERAGWGLACGYGAASVAGGLVCVAAGVGLAERGAGR